MPTRPILVESTRLENAPRWVCGDPVETGAVPGGIVGELEALKWRLAAMDTADDLPAGQSAALAAEISAIRLHLKRLDLERAAIVDAMVRRSNARV